MLALLLMAGLLSACETEPLPRSANPTASETHTPAPSPTLHLNDTPVRDGHETIDVLGLEATALARLHGAHLTRAEWRRLLAIHTGETLPADLAATPPMLGTYAILENGIRFTPRFPLVAGLTYTARFDLALFYRAYADREVSVNQEAVIASFALPKPATASATIVRHVYPTTDVLPMNQLKMYIHFSAPMRRGEAYDHIRLRYADTGEEVTDPFVIIEQELWDAERTRFTLLFDPGRIKQDLRPNLEQGLPLQEGKRYRLVIDAGWRDAAGNPLVEPFEKTFSVTAADRLSPHYDAWKMTPPHAGTTAPLTLTFDEPLDHALLQRLLIVRNANGDLIDGRIEVARAETQWSLIPAQAWEAGPYVIEVAAVLEDLAGNNLRHVFDVDLATQTPDRSAEQVPVRLPFEVKPPNTSL